MAIKKKAAAAKKTTPKTEQPKELPPIGPDDYTFVLTTNEIFSLVQILDFSRDVFKQMSLNCAGVGDSQGEKTYAARSELSDILFRKVRSIASIGEPTSRALH